MKRFASIMALASSFFMFSCGSQDQGDFKSNEERDEDNMNITTDTAVNMNSGGGLGTGTNAADTMIYKEDSRKK